MYIAQGRYYATVRHQTHRVVHPDGTAGDRHRLRGDAVDTRGSGPGHSERRRRRLHRGRVASAAGGVGDGPAHRNPVRGLGHRAGARRLRNVVLVGRPGDGTAGRAHPGHHRTGHPGHRAGRGLRRAAGSFIGHQAGQPYRLPFQGVHSGRHIHTDVSSAASC